MSSNLQRRSLGLLFLFSGVPGLVAQLTWGRLFAAGLGHEIPSLIGVVSAFFLGLAVGAWLLQQPVVRSRRPLLWYAGLECFCAAWTAVSAPLLPGFCNELLQWVGLDPGWVRQGLVCGGAPFLALGPATAALGATLPAIDAAMRRAGAEARWTGWLYGLNTVGAMAGALLAVGWLMPTFGFCQTLWWAASIQAGCGVLAGWLALRTPTVATECVVGAKESPVTASTAAGLAWGAGLSGVLGVGFEWLALRGLAHATENTIQTYACGLAALLGGMSLGAVWQRWAKVCGKSWGTAGAAAWVAGAIVLSAVTMSVVPRLRWTPASWLGSWGGEMALITLVFVVPAIPMGVLYAGLLDAIRDEHGGVGWVIGWNAVGAALSGPLVVGLVLPWFGLKGALGMVAAGYGVAFPPLCRGWRVGALAGVLVIFWCLPSPLQVLEVPTGATVRRLIDGQMASVAVIRTSDGHRALRVNNHFQQGGTATASAARRHAHLPLLLHPAPRRALFLGIGTGVTLGAGTAHPGLVIDGVELLPEVVAVLPEFAPENQEPGRRANVQLQVADARRFARVSARSYDVVVADLFHPSEDGAGFLYTREHFAAMKSRLAPGGLLCQWLPLHQMDLETFRCVARTFLEVFPDASLWLLRFNADLPVLGLIGGRDVGPKVLDPEALARRMEVAGLREALGPVALNSPARVLGCRVAGTTSLRTFAGEGRVATDDRPYVLFEAARAAYRSGEMPGDRLLRLLGDADPEFSEILSPAQRPIWEQKLRAFRVARDLHLKGLVLESNRQREAAIDAYVASAEASGDYTAGYAQAVMVASAYAREDPAWSRRVLERLVQSRPGERLAADVLERLPSSGASPR